MHKHNRNKIIKKIINLIDNIINSLLLCICIFMLSFGIYTMYDSNSIYEEADSSNYAQYKPTAGNEFSFDEMLEINNEIVAWVNVFGTNIDYPIVRAINNEKYLNLNPLGEFSLAGSIFLDYRNSPDFSDFSSILYGHHMEKKVMFGQIAEFTSESVFNRYKYGSLYYNGKEHGLEFFAFLEVDAYNSSIFAVHIEDRQAFLDNLLKSSMYTRDVDISTDDHLIYLSTCTSNITNGRHILVAKITDEIFENTFSDSTTVFDSEELFKKLNDPIFIYIIVWSFSLIFTIIVIKKYSFYR